MSLLLTYRSGQSNQASIIKGGSELAYYAIEFADGIPSSSVTITTVAVTALNSSNVSATSTVVGTTAISGTQVTQVTLTAGTNGTQAAIDGSRFKITSIATLSNGEQLEFDTFLLNNTPVYGP